MRDTYTMLPIEEQNEDEQIMTVGDDILSQFYYGNYSNAIKMMLNDNINPQELGEYLEDMSKQYDIPVADLYGGHFTISFMGAVSETYGNAICRGVA